MEAFAPLLLLCLLVMYSPYHSPSLPMCTNLREPVTANEPLAFCPSYKGRVCCDPTKDSQLQTQYVAMDIKNPECCFCYQVNSFVKRKKNDTLRRGMAESNTEGLHDIFFYSGFIKELSSYDPISGYGKCRHT